MPSLHDLSNADLLARGRLTLTNALADADLLAALTPRGYDQATLEAAQADFDAFEARIYEREDLAGQQVAATQAFNEAWTAFKQAGGPYSTHRALANLVFRSETGTRRRLGLTQSPPSAFGRWVQHARLFYTTALGDAVLLARLATRGLTQPDLEAALAEIDRLVALDQAQEDLKGRAQQATRDRNAQRTVVQDWLRTFDGFAGIALVGRPDWLERLGILNRA